MAKELRPGFLKPESTMIDDDAPKGTERQHQLYARIRESSKYHGQTKDGALFPVYIDPNAVDVDYVVKGGPGGQYRLRDVDLIVIGERGYETVISGAEQASE